MSTISANATNDNTNKPSTTPGPDARAIPNQDPVNKTAAPLAPESFWKRIVDHAPAMLWCIDRNGTPVYYNQRWLRFAGLTTECDFSEAWYKKLHPEDRDWVLKQSGEALKSQKSVRMEYRLERFDGSYRHVLDMGEPQHAADGQFVGYIGSTVDITEQREASNQLEESHRQLNQSSSEISLLNEFNDNLQVCKSIDETLPILKRYGRKLFPDASVSICLYSESRNIVEPFAFWGDSVTLDRMFSPDQCWALRRGKTHVEQPCRDGSLCPNSRNCKIKFGYACIPMMAYGEVIGVLNICFHQQDQLTGENGRAHRLAQTTADQVALAIANLKLRETLQHQSTRDPLTQLFNRRYLLDNLEREFCRAGRDGSSIVLLMLDVDNFKRFNDTYGHEAGDLVLRELGIVLRQSARSADITCRYGGEEFLIALIDSCEEDAVVRAEEIRRKISEMVVILGKQPLGNVTASIGMACYPDDNDSIDRLLSNADQALYAAKSAGRNRVVRYRTMFEVIAAGQTADAVSEEASADDDDALSSESGKMLPRVKVIAPGVAMPVVDLTS